MDTTSKNMYDEAKELLANYVDCGVKDKPIGSGCNCCCASYGGGKARYQDKKLDDKQ